MSDENGTRPYPPHDLAPELDELDVAYAQLLAELKTARAERDAYRRVIEVLSRAGDLDSVRGVAWAALAKIGATKARDE